MILQDIPWPDGIVPSLNTPFARDGSVDAEGYGRLVLHLAGEGCAGALALAVAGEGPSLTEAECRTLLRSAVRAAQSVPGQFPIIASLGSDPDLAMHRAGLYAEDGADVLLYQAPPGGDLVSLGPLLRRLSDAGRPLMLQDFDPAGSGLAIEDIVALSRDVPAFRYLKVETIPSGPKQSAVLAATAGRMHVSGGWAVNEMLDAMDRGIHAFIPTELEPVYVEIFAAHRRGNRERASALFGRIAPVLEFANRDVGTSIRFLKRLRQRRGLFETDICRSGVAEFDAATNHEAERLIGVALSAIAAAR